MFRLLLYLCAIAIAAPLRVISTSPEITELFFQLGKGSDLVATPEYSEFPPEALKLPVLGPLFSPSLEMTAKLAPDWVLLDEANLSPAYQRGLQSLGQKSLTLSLSRVANVFEESERLLRTLYLQAPGFQLARYRACWRALPTSGPRRFLAFAWLSPPILIGHPTYLSDLLTRTVGINALPTYLKLPYPPVSEDWLAGRAPDAVYLLSSIGTPEAQARALFRKWWPGWNGEVRFLDGATFSRSTLTPLKHLSELKADLPKECRELP